VPFLTVGLLTPSAAIKSQCGQNSKRLDWKDSVAYIGPARTTAWLEMISQSNSYRYYYCYGPLSTWRDGRAMSCRETIR